MRSFRASQLPQPPPSASKRSARSPLPPAPVNAEYYDENGANIRVYGGNGTINLDPKHPDPFADGKSISTNGSSTHSTNIIPIQYIPPSRSEEGISQAARTLDEARQNLFKPKPAPQRPARSPDLDLRLNPPSRDLRSPGADFQPGRIRESFLSENSGAPSFLSGNSYDVYNDAPKIVTSKQVHVGRLQQAEVVQFGRNPSGGLDQSGGDPFNNALDVPRQRQHELGLASPATFGSRSLTPTSTREYDNGMEEGLEEPATGASGDLRFSMGSLQYRDSVSTMGTDRYLARPDSFAVPPPRGQFDGPRESMFSTKSYADSVLSGFPMIPPNQAHNIPAVPSSSIPQSTSIATLDHASAPSSRPPPSFRQPKAAQAESRTVSMADSFLGSFPFVPPNMDDLAELPSAAIPTAAVPETAKKGGRGMSSTSEGLGGFEFSIEGRGK